jgi:hypothetical protein
MSASLGAAPERERTPTLGDVPLPSLDEDADGHEADEDGDDTRDDGHDSRDEHGNEDD